MNTQNESIKVEYQDTKIKPVYGGKRCEVTYTMTHTKHGRTNQYNVTCELYGLADCDPRLNVYGAEWIGDPEKTNEETLTESAAADLFAEHVGI